MSNSIPLDADTYVRLRCLEAVTQMAEYAAEAGVVMFTDTGEIADGVNELAHAVSNGLDVGFTCSPDSEQFVRSNTND